MHSSPLKGVLKEKGLQMEQGTKGARLTDPEHFVALGTKLNRNCDASMALHC